MKLPFFIETQLNKILKPQIITIVETFIDGKPSRKFYGKSLVGNFLQSLYAQFSQGNANFIASPAPYGNNVNVIRITGVATSGNNIPFMDAAAGILTKGIVLGSNNTAPVPGDIVLNTPIVHGAGAGQLQYGAQLGIQGTTMVAQNSTFILQRTFTNGSGGNVTCREIAMYVTLGGNTVMIYRDAVAPDDVIGNGQVYTVNITFQITT